MRLFDDTPRSDSSPAAYSEDSFSFLNRVATPYWEKIRVELDEWFSEYPVEHAADLRARFRSADPRQHFPAWWELYLFRLFRRLGFHIAVHPDVSSTTARPDFLITRGNERTYVEAVAVFSGIVEEGRHGAREAWIQDLINEASSPNFFVGLDFEKVGTERPSRKEVISPIEDWLAGLDPDVVTEEYGAGLGLPELRLLFRDWDLTVEALPIKPEARGDPSHRLLGRGPMSGGWVNDIEVLQRSLGRKFRHYGQLDEPFVVAALGLSSFLDISDFEQALFGRHAVEYQRGNQSASRWVRQRDGVWMASRGPVATSVAAVIGASGLQPSTCARELPRLWVNPWANHPLGIQLPFATATAEESGEVKYSDATTTASEVLGLPEEWPGPERPFG